MPIFEYTCSRCGRISEFLQKTAGAAGRKCLHCGSSDLTRQLSVFSARVKEGQSKKCLSCTDTGCPHAHG